MEINTLQEALEFTFKALKNGKTYRCKHIGTDNLLFHNQETMREYPRSKFLKGIEDLEQKINLMDAGLYELSASDILLIELLMDMILGQDQMNEIYKKNKI